ncbi:lamin tail domain-containing protein [bacterium]|nr:lamin tail domain-containing protein [bacterium]MBU1984911.1 lamin tail domain-containing protein [bacterium]
MRSIAISVIIGFLLLSSEAPGLTLNEIMYNPSGDENDDEYIELFNNSPHAVNLDGWRVTDGADTDRVIALEHGLLVQSNRYVLILDPDYFENGSTTYDGRIPENALVVTIDNSTFGSRGLSNSTAETVSLISPQGQTVSSYTYTLGNEQGQSEEKILPTAGDGSSNWTEAVTLGGTPGGRNSVTPPEQDLAITSLTYAPVDARVGETIEITVRVENVGLQPMRDSLFLYERIEPSGTTDSLHVLNRWLTAILSPGDSEEFRRDWTLPDESIHTFVAKLSGRDDRHSNDEWAIAIGTSGAQSWLVINEIMYQPESQRSEWIELYNASVLSWNLAGWRFGDGTALLDTSRLQLLPEIVLPPMQFIVLAADSQVLFENIPPTVPVMIWNSGEVTLNNSGDSLVLFDSHHQLVDRVDYRPSWGNGEAGVSIERISAYSASNDPLNWAASLDSTGSTLGRTNSRTLPSTGMPRQLLVLEPNPFSPDGDGHEDVLFIRFRLEHGDSRIDVKIYDVRGRAVRRLANNAAAGFSGEILWDGRDDGGQFVPTGLYIVYLEALGKGGTRMQSAKRPVALARRS